MATDKYFKYLFFIELLIVFIYPYFNLKILLNFYTTLKVSVIRSEYENVFTSIIKYFVKNCDAVFLA